MHITKIKEFIESLNTMTLKDKDLYEQYMFMKSASRVIDERIDEVGNMIVEEMNRVGEIKKEFEFGKFTIGSRKSYKYSPKVEELNEKVKVQKKIEEEDGTAEVTEKNYLLFK